MSGGDDTALAAVRRRDASLCILATGCAESTSGSPTPIRGWRSDARAAEKRWAGRPRSRSVSSDQRTSVYAEFRPNQRVRLQAPAPASPVPTRSSVPGSGTGVVTVPGPARRSSCEPPGPGARAPSDVPFLVDGALGCRQQCVVTWGVVSAPSPGDASNRLKGPPASQTAGRAPGSEQATRR